MNTIRIVPTDEKYAESFNRASDVIARERRYIGYVEGPPIEATQEFIRSFSLGAGIQYVALDETDTVVGWADILRNQREGFRHGGVLGMALMAHVRGQGLGTRLATTVIEHAWRLGMERVELEVYASNTRAKRLYDKLGFVVEGVKRRSRKLDDEYDDNIVMALLRCS